MGKEPQGAYRVARLPRGTFGAKMQYPCGGSLWTPIWRGRGFPHTLYGGRVVGRRDPPARMPSFWAKMTQKKSPAFGWQKIDNLNESKLTKKGSFSL